MALNRREQGDLVPDYVLNEAAAVDWSLRGAPLIAGAIASTIYHLIFMGIRILDAIRSLARFHLISPKFIGFDVV